MPITALDPVAALIVIDLQNGMLGYPTVHPLSEVIARAGELAGAFRAHHLPVVLVNVKSGSAGRKEQGGSGGARPDGFADLVPELNQQPGDHTLTKTTWGAFTGTGLDEYLRGKGVTQVVVAGVATSLGVESTARQAAELGFNVTLATDAMTDLSPDAHANSLTWVFPKMGETGKTRDIIDLLSRRAA